jgi:hypothetical protein
MYHILGYTNFAESVTAVGTDSYDPTHMTGVVNFSAVGSINVSGSDFNFRDNTNSPFLVGHVGWWILLKDPTNPKNSGWYRISAYVDASNVTIDYRSGATEYPIQNTSNNMSYWMMAEDNETPDTLTDEWQLRTPHADGWEIKFELHANHYLWVTVALDTFVVGNKVLTTQNLAVPPGALMKNLGDSGGLTPSDVYRYAVGADDGSSFTLWWHHQTGTAANALAIAKLTPWETSPAHTAAELWVLSGNESVPSSNSGSFYRGTVNPVSGAHTGLVWREWDASVVRAYLMEWSSLNSNEGLILNSLTTSENNARTGKIDLKPNDHWATVPATLPGTETAPYKYEFLGTTNQWEGCRYNLTKMQTIDDAGTKDKCHIYQGFVVPWPNVTPQLLPA